MWMGLPMAQHVIKLPLLSALRFDAMLLPQFTVITRRQRMANSTKCTFTVSISIPDLAQRRRTVRMCAL
jgi:hypothetical protein